MQHRYYTGYQDGAHTPLSQRPLPAYELHRAGSYQPGPGLVAAANVAILLGQPLLLTGEPGTGKTQFSYALGRELGLQVHECLVKSSTSARDLFYSFDELARFRDSHAGARHPLQRYLSFNGLGRAILFAGGRAQPLEQLPGLAFENMATGATQPDQRPRVFGDLYPAAAFPDTPQPSVVLIDELDKAPRDTPNDMLNEIERLGFDIPELGVRMAAPPDPKTRPVIVITSNSEKSLPEPFLRRCVYFDIPFPDAKAVREIALAQVKGLDGESPLLREALDLFDWLRDRSRIQRLPGTAELLAWLDLLRSACPAGCALRAALTDAKFPGQAMDLLEGTLAALIKKTEDRGAARELIQAWAIAA